MPLASFDTGNSARPVAEPLAHYSRRSFYPLEQTVADFDKLDGELTPPSASTTVMIVGSSALACLGLIAALAWLGNSLN